jgi:hypothetical protein
LLTDILAEDLDNHFKIPNQIASTIYTGWTLAQILTALKMTDREHLIYSKADNIAAFLRDPNRQISGCDCWNEWVGDPPQHIAISAWTLYSLASIGVRPSTGEIQFLLETQGGTGGWNMFNVPFNIRWDANLQRPEGSSFATAWAILAFSEFEKKKLISDQTLAEKLRGSLRHGIDFFLNNGDNRDRKYGLWSLYPGWAGTRNVSRGTSGLVLYALHESSAGLNVQERKRFSAELQDADKSFIDALAESEEGCPNLASGDSYSSTLPYQPIQGHSHTAAPGVQRVESKKGLTRAHPDTASIPAAVGPIFKTDSVFSLTLPWMIIGAQVAYGSGNYLDRVKVLKFIDIALRRVDEDWERALKEKSWMKPELLMSVRILQTYRPPDR